MISDDSFKVRRLGHDDVPRILELEQASWVPWLQADADLLHHRLELGHVFLGAEVDGRLDALMTSRLGRFHPDDLGDFPRTFAAYSGQPSSQRPNAGCVYNLNVRRGARGYGLARKLMAEARDIARGEGCEYLIGDGRCPSYNGSDNNAYERIRCSPDFRSVIDRYFETGEFPCDEELTIDPVLRFYHRKLKCTFVLILRDFLPADGASGGHRVIFYKRILDAHNNPIEP